MIEDKSTITINDETTNTEETNKTSKIEGADVTSKIEGADVTSMQEVSTDDLKTEEVSKMEETITSDEPRVAIEIEESITNNAVDSALNVIDSIQGNNADDNKSESQAPTHKPANAPANTPKQTNNNAPWDDDEPITEDDLINELVYHGGMAKNVAKEMIEKLKVATDTELRKALINHIAWHIATGGPTNKINGSKGKALHKEDIIAALNKIL